MLPLSTTLTGATRLFFSVEQATWLAICRKQHLQSNGVAPSSGQRRQTLLGNAGFQGILALAATQGKRIFHISASPTQGNYFLY